MSFSEFVETQVFTELVKELLTDDEYRKLQAFLSRNPQAGDVIQGGRGLRKLRWRSTDTGKRGGYRVIYYNATFMRQIRMLLVYKKGKQEDLTPAQTKRLVEIMNTWEC